ncbi:hypothetical protein HYP93_gp93 [Stenotrophomonas phage Pokken]|uniref:Uncharacterized protein n=1 Tax=Stenotrophomonas phage Pokken TaxID=2596674 RepID=A0A5B9N5N0_9CAUD|nr:hypothetical protein HYP93_gp93 [Stenotrophomonas phage Pokken]QEG09264.1 hypothetical protein CPT_Pokken_044 [Stenotrophomonas phage Pokken]
MTLTAANKQKSPAVYQAQHEFHVRPELVGEVVAHQGDDRLSAWFKLLPHVRLTHRQVSEG